MTDFMTILVAMLFFVAVFSFIGGFDLVGIYIPSFDQSYVHGHIDLLTSEFVPLQADGTVGVAVTKNNIECTKFTLDIDLDYPVEATVIYYDNNYEAVAVTESITESLHMDYKDMPHFCESIRVQVRRTDGKGFSDADLLTLSTKVRLVTSTEKQDWLSKWLDSWRETTPKFELLPGADTVRPWNETA